MVFGTTKVILLALFVLQAHVENVRTTHCGVPQVIRNKLIIIHHGSRPYRGEWPWHAAIYHRQGPGYVYVCGGTLISELFVLSAAYCMISENGDLKSKKSSFVRLGIHNLNELSISLQQYAVEMIHIHENYSVGNVQNDIAILKLITMAEITNFVQPACLGMGQGIAGLLGTIVGWGETESEESSDLKSARIPIVDSKLCLKNDRPTFGETLSKGIICAGYTNGTNICKGDSGSGLFFNQNGLWYLGGILTSNEHYSLKTGLCNTNGYGIFTRVNTFLQWITSITGLKVKGGDSDDVCEPKDVDTNESSRNLLPADCGNLLPDANSTDNFRADLFEYPWMAMLRYYRSSNLSYTFLECEGTLINHRYVLTAAQCADDDDLTIKVTLGEYNVYQLKDCAVRDGVENCAPDVEEYELECVLRHQNYSRRAKNNDIALLRLARPVTFKKHIRPICLPANELVKKLKVNRYLISSWGVQQDALRESSVVHVDRSVCQKQFKDENVAFQNDYHCARMFNSTDECFWNIGTPLVVRATDRKVHFIQFGVASFGLFCFNNYPFVYTKVFDHIGWIQANVRP